MSGVNFLIPVDQLVHIPVVIDLSLGFQHTHIFGVLQEFGGKNEVVEFLILGKK